MILFNLFLGGMWLLLTREWTVWNYLFGCLLSYFFLYISGQYPEKIRFSGRNFDLLGYIRWFVKVLAFVLYFLKELVVASLTVTLSILSPLSKLRPGVIAVPLDLQTDGQITLLANLITLTPGTLTLDVSTDKKIIFVHAIHVDDPAEFCQSIKNGFEKWILEVSK